MSKAIRGAEAAIAVTVSDEFAAAFGIYGRMEGSFFKVNDFTATPRTDLIERDYIGQKFTDLDIQHHGWDLSFTIDEEDAAAINFMDLVIYKEENNLPPPEVGIQCTYVYRDTNVLPRTEKYVNCVMKLAERSNAGRKEYISNSFEGKAKEKKTIVG